jgi:hypothetical protein
LRRIASKNWKHARDRGSSESGNGKALFGHALLGIGLTKTQISSNSFVICSKSCDLREYLYLLFNVKPKLTRKKHSAI